MAQKLNWGNKVRNEGKTAAGRLSAEEANDLQAKFNANAGQLDLATNGLSSETERATSAEEFLDEKINTEITNTIEYVNQGDEQNAAAVSELAAVTLPTPSNETFIIL